MATPGGPSLAHRRRQQRLGARAGRGGAAVHHASVQVPLPVRPSAAECGALLKALIKHLLFQRAQIPYLYDELLRAAQQQQHAAAEEAAQAAAEGRRVRRRRAPKGDRRLLKVGGCACKVDAMSLLRGGRACGRRAQSLPQSLPSTHLRSAARWPPWPSTRPVRLPRSR